MPGLDDRWYFSGRILLPECVRTTLSLQQMYREGTDMAAKPQKKYVWRIIQDGQVITERADGRLTRELILQGKMRSDAKVALIEIETQYGEEKPHDVSDEIDFARSTLIQDDTVSRLLNPKGYFQQAGMFIGAALLAIIPTFVSLAAIQDGAFGIKDWVVKLVHGPSARAYQYEWIVGPLPFWILWIIWFLIMLIPGFFIGLLLSKIMSGKTPRVPESFWVTPAEEVKAD